MVAGSARGIIALIELYARPDSILAMIFWIDYSIYDRCFHAELINESRYCMPLAGPWVVAQIKSGRGYVELAGNVRSISDLYAMIG